METVPTRPIPRPTESAKAKGTSQCKVGFLYAMEVSKDCPG